jgi:hypothetical protein
VAVPVTGWRALFAAVLRQAQLVEVLRELLPLLGRELLLATELEAGLATTLRALLAVVRWAVSVRGRAFSLAAVLRDQLG